jgi:predicted alpha/beta superfamily hydrolase
MASSEMAINAERIDLTSNSTGRSYRLFVSVPAGEAPAGGWPVLYLIDGNLHFGIAVDAARIQAPWPDVRNPIVVGIGYPTDSVAKALDFRMPDLTTPPSEGYLSGGWIANMPTPGSGYGDMDRYLDFLIKEVKPLIVERFAAAAADATLMGHSLGGLTTLHALFRHPGAFQNHVAISPSIWWDSRAVLNHEAPFVERLQRGEVKARILISAGEEEDPAFQRFAEGEGPMPLATYNAMALDCRIAQDVRGLVGRLTPLQRPGFEVQGYIHPGDDHNTVPPAAIARGVRFAFRRGF